MKKILFIGVILFFIEITLNIFVFTSSKQSSIPSKPISMYNSPPKQVDYCIRKYCGIYEIPLYIAYNMAYLETSYRGPLDIKYRHNKTSICGAEGVLQIMPSTASFIHKEKVDRDKLRNNVGFNIKTGLMYLAYLKKRYKRWDIALGYYNTGYPKVNSYSYKILLNKNYTTNWIK